MEFSRHARDRMRERGISEAEVEEAISHAIGTTAYRRGRAVIRGRAGRRTLKVVKDVDTQVVITVEVA